MTDTPAPHNGEFDGNTTPEALAAWERYKALPENPGTAGYSQEWREQDAFTAGFDAAGYRKPTVQPTARPTTEGGVWGSYVAYLEALESRVQPTVEDVARKLAEWGVRSKHGEWSDAETQLNAAKDIHALFTTAPTVADVREQVAREIEAARPGLGVRQSALTREQMAYDHAARVARGGDTQ